MIKKSLKLPLNLVKKLSAVFANAIKDFNENDGTEHAGYIAFLLMLSFFPFVIFLTFILGIIGQTTIGIHFTNILINIIPKDMASIFVPRVKEIISEPSSSILSLALVSILWTASSFVEGLREILNKIYRVKHKPRYILGRLLSIIEFCCITLTIILAILGLIILPKIMQVINNILIGNGHHATLVWENTRSTITYVIIFFMISLLYFMLPNKKQKMHSVFPGALITLIGWGISGKLFSLYLQHFNQFSVVYGSLGGVIIALLFFYIISIVLIFGAEFNYHFEENFYQKALDKINIFKK